MGKGIDAARADDDNVAKRMLWRRPALISCKSLNNDDGYHMVYWDGERVWDPHEGHWHLGWQFFRHLSSLSISQAQVIDPTQPRDPPAPAKPADVAAAQVEPVA